MALNLNTFTTLEAKSTPASAWTEDQKRKYLLQINAKENPQELVRLQKLLAIYTADEVAEQCDEHGHLKYQDAFDPNALVNRFMWQNVSSTWDSRSETTMLDADYYFPSIAAVYETRYLAARALEGRQLLEEQPKLETIEDYMAYFNSFNPIILDRLINNLGWIGLTDGCNGPCKKVCVAMATGPATSEIPYPIVDQLIRRHYTYGPLNMLIRNQGKAITPYHNTDIADYPYSDAVYNLIRGLSNAEPYVSTAFSLAPNTINLLFKFIVLWEYDSIRISRLASGKKEGDIERLIEKVKKYTEENGEIFTAEHANIIRAGCKEGEKEQLNTMAGNAITPDTEEKDTSSTIYACKHTIGFMAGKGFQAHIIRPTSKRYPSQELIIPITPKSSEVIIPKNTFLGTRSYFPPEKLDAYHFIERPVIRSYRQDGTCTRRDYENDDGLFVNNIQKLKGEIQVIARSIEQYSKSWNCMTTESKESTMKGLIETCRSIFDSLVSLSLLVSESPEDQKMIREIHLTANYLLFFAVTRLSEIAKKMNDGYENWTISLTTEISQFISSIIDKLKMPEDHSSKQS